jgi:hypothetical protein
LNRRLAEVTIDVDEMVKRIILAPAWNETNRHTEVSQLYNPNSMWDSIVLISCEIS